MSIPAEFGVQTRLFPPKPIHIATLQAQIANLELRHGMTTSAFLELFRHGELGETPENVEWSRLATVVATLRG